MGLSLSDVGLYELNTAVRNLKDGRYSPCIFHLAMLGDENLSETHVDQFEDWKFYLQLVMDIMSRNRVLEVILLLIVWFLLLSKSLRCSLVFPQVLFL